MRITVEGCRCEVVTLPAYLLQNVHQPLGKGAEVKQDKSGDILYLSQSQQISQRDCNQQ